MKKFSNKMVLSVLTLVLLVVALGTTTFAWFTVGNTASVQEFEANVSSGEGLEIAYFSGDTNRSGYVRTITTAQITGYLVADYGYSDWATDFELKPVTSTDGKKFQQLQEDYTLTEEALGIGKKVGGYIEFELRFRTKATGASLVWESVSLDSTVKNWTPELAFIPVGGSVPSSAAADYKAANGARVSLTRGDVTKVYERPSGLDDDNVNNAVLGSSTPDFGHGAHDYFERVTGKDLSDNFATYQAVGTITSLTPEVVLGSFDDDGSLVDGYRVLTVTVRIYLEGFDSETFNAIIGNDLKIALGFKLKTA